MVWVCGACVHPMSFNLAKGCFVWNDWNEVVYFLMVTHHYICSENQMLYTPNLYFLCTHSYGIVVFNWTKMKCHHFVNNSIVLWYYRLDAQYLVHVTILIQLVMHRLCKCSRLCGDYTHIYSTMHSTYAKFVHGAHECGSGRRPKFLIRAVYQTLTAA